MNAFSAIRSRLGRLFTVRDIARAYQLTFCTPQGKSYVLPDLAEFCHASDPAPRESDLFVQGRAAGRRDVWLRVQEHLHLTKEELVQLYANRLSLKPEDFNRG